MNLHLRLLLRARCLMKRVHTTIGGESRCRRRGSLGGLPSMKRGQMHGCASCGTRLTTFSQGYLCGIPCARHGAHNGCYTASVTMRRFFQHLSSTANARRDVGRNAARTVRCGGCASTMLRISGSTKDRHGRQGVTVPRTGTSFDDTRQNQSPFVLLWPRA